MPGPDATPEIHMTAAVIATLLATLGLALVHLLSGALRFLDVIPRSRWLSMAGGVAVTLVFLDILPGLARSQATVDRSLGPARSFLENHVYIVALVGLTIIYGMDRVVKRSRAQQRAAGAGDHTDRGAFWLSIAVFVLKNVTVGYLLVREARPPIAFVLFFVALALEFTVSDRAMHADHKARYDRVGRWVLAGAVLLGWTVGYLTLVPELALAMLSGLLAGMIVLNVFREELPAEQESRFWAFAAGAAGYAVLLLAA